MKSKLFGGKIAEQSLYNLWPKLSVYNKNIKMRSKVRRDYGWSKSESPDKGIKLTPVNELKILQERMDLMSKLTEDLQERGLQDRGLEKINIHPTGMNSIWSERCIGWSPTAQEDRNQRIRRQSNSDSKRKPTEKSELWAGNKWPKTHKTRSSKGEERVNEKKN